MKLNGYFNDTVDGIFGATTQNALQSYQSKKKLTVTGKADYTTIMSLFGKVSETTVADDPLMRGITKISEITVPATSKKGDTGDNVLALQQALKIKGYFTAPIQDTFGIATQTAVLAYQKANKLTQTGEADAATIRSLFNANAANHAYITSQLYWQDGDSTIPKKAVFTVKDCQTGLTFRCSRWSGYNHLEAEPLTAEDTAVMQKIYKSWSWARRPILVLYNGSVYAASMNGMPQEGYNIQNNNFDGHFCIHFTGSKTHGTKVVDSQHRNCVQQALKYRW